MKKTDFIHYILVALFTVSLATATGDTQPETSRSKVFRFGVLPEQAAGKLLESWAPLLSYLEQYTGYRFVFETAPDIPTFEARIESGEYDFAYLNPYHFTVFNKGEQGYQAVAKARNRLVRGVLVVRKDSHIVSPSGLAGETLAFPAATAFGASILPRAHLGSAKISYDIRYVSSHDSVYRAVAEGFFSAGGGIVRTLDNLDPDVRGQLRVLWASTDYTPHAIAARSEVDVAVRMSVRQSLNTMHDNNDGREALKILKLPGFESADNSDWDDVRSLHIDTYLSDVN